MIKTANINQNHGLKNLELFEHDSESDGGHILQDQKSDLEVEVSLFFGTDT
jgi:hypothetical protein